MEIDDQIKRIKYYEEILNKGDKITEELINNLEEFIGLENKLGELEDYYASKLYMSDLKDDQEGKFPKDLARGIYSEDAIYNLLSKIDYIKSKLR